jgi:hypothetical protein
MQVGNLAFLENFYTDITLFIPPEAAVAPAAVAAAKQVAVENVPAAPLPQAASVAAAPPVIAAVTATAASPMPTSAAVAAPAPPRPLVAPARLPEAAIQASSAPDSQHNITPVAAAVTPPVAAVPPAQLTPFTTLGTNAQGVVLLVRLPPDQFVKLPRNVFLNKMLQALNLVMADVVLVNVESHLPVALSSLRRELAATQIVAFGRNLLDVTIRNTQIYEPVQFPQLGFAYLAAAEIEMVEYDVSLKKRLWPGLQSMFL